MCKISNWIEFIQSNKPQKGRHGTCNATCLINGFFLIVKDMKGVKDGLVSCGPKQRLNSRHSTQQWTRKIFKVASF